MKKTYQKEGGLAWIGVALAVVLLLAGVGFGMFIKKPENASDSLKPTVTPAIVEDQSKDIDETDPELDKSVKGYIEGGLTYPGEMVPPEVGVCAELATDPNFKICGGQIKDKKYKTGVGFKIEVDPGIYYVYALYKEKKAYYNQFVVCGLAVECKDRTKIPVIVKAGETASAMPDDWYEADEPAGTPSPSPFPTIIKIKLIPTIAPTAVPTLTKLQINPEILQKITFPSPTPTPIVTPKINVPKLNINF